MKLGNQPVSFTAQFYDNAVHSAGTPAWACSYRLRFLLPKLTNEEHEMLTENALKQLEQQTPQEN